MFGSQDEKKPVQISPEPEFDPKTIPVHTMQDDLDVLSGKVQISNPILTGEERNPNFNAPNQDQFKSASAIQRPSNPFEEIPENHFPVGDPNRKMPVKISRNENIVPREAIIPPKTPIVPKEPAKNSNSGKIFAILGGILVILGAFGGGYYFYMTRYNNLPEEVVVLPPETVPEEVPIEIPKEPIIIEKFSADKPNYLMLDVETMTAEDIQKLLLQKGVEIEADGKTAPVEFVITDSNNNPIALKIFAQLVGFSFSPNLLNNLKDEFSMFIYSDGGKTRLGLNIEAKDQAKILVDLKNEEKVLAKNMKGLFLGETAKNLTVPLQNNQYKGFSIRYVNLNDQNDLSVDYFVSQGRIILATSKNATWAIIDKMANSGQ